MSPKLNLFTSAVLASTLLASPLTLTAAQASGTAATLTTELSAVETAPPAAEVPIAPLAVPEAVETAPETAPTAIAEPPLAVDTAEAFIDRNVDYSLGATQQAPSGYEAPSEIVIIPGTQSATTADSTSAIAPPTAPIALESVNVNSGGVNWSESSAAATTSSSNGQSNYANVNPGLPYLGNKLLQAFARMGNENLKMLFPVGIPAEITSLFGWRIHPISGTQRMHTGTDIGAPMGTPVLASLSGRVILADMMGGYGLTVAIEHDNGVRQTMYAHLSELFVKPGDMVQQGTVIGRVGSTGASTGPHLHFEFRQMMPDGTWVALDAGQHLQVALGDLVKSLQIAQQAIKPVAQNPKKP
jgi:murein DD-endopeptidase MepM/ murein hydrolase activator NlpD